jgi:hypothetical protein
VVEVIIWPSTAIEEDLLRGMRRKSMFSTTITGRKITLTLILTTPDGEITQIFPEETTKTTNPKTRTKVPIRTDQIRDTGRGNLTKALRRNLIWNK